MGLVPSSSVIAVWAKSTGSLVDQLFTVTGWSSGEEKTMARPTTRTATTKKAMTNSLTMSYGS